MATLSPSHNIIVSLEYVDLCIYIPIVLQSPNRSFIFFIFFFWHFIYCIYFGLTLLLLTYYYCYYIEVNLIIVYENNWHSHKVQKSLSISILYSFILSGGQWQRFHLLWRIRPVYTLKLYIESLCACCFFSFFPPQYFKYCW